jgi:hypothetical protein
VLYFQPGGSARRRAQHLPRAKRNFRPDIVLHRIAGDGRDGNGAREVPGPEFNLFPLAASLALE